MVAGVVIQGRSIVDDIPGQWVEAYKVSYSIELTWSYVKNASGEIAVCKIV